MTTNQQRGTPHAPLTQARIDKFLEVLRETGSPNAAAAAASPHAIGERPGLSTFRDLRKRDPGFALAYQEAMEFYLGALEQAIAHWAITPGERPIVSGKTGEIVAVEKRPPDPRLLLAALRRHDPSWREKTDVNVSGQVDHVHSGGIAMAQINAEDVMRLPPHERDQFADLLARIIKLKDTDPRVIEHQPEDTGDG